MKRVTYFLGILAILGILTGCEQQISSEMPDTVTSTMEALDVQTVVISETDENMVTSETETLTYVENTEETEEVVVVTESSVQSIDEKYIVETTSEDDLGKEIKQEVSGEVVCIRITDGSNGNQMYVTDADTINTLLEKANQLEILTEENESRVGYQYSLQYLDSQNNLVKSIIIQGNYIVIDKKNYKVTSTEEIVDCIENIR